MRLARACYDDNVARALYPGTEVVRLLDRGIVTQDALLDAVEDAVLDVVVAPAELMPVFVVGAPVRYRHRIHNTAVVVHRGRGVRRGPEVVPAHLPEFSNADSSPRRRSARRHPDGRRGCAVRTRLAFTATDMPGFVLHVEMCEDMFVPVPPSAQAALAGAAALTNLSGSPITIGRAEDRCLLARSTSSRCLAAYGYAAAGEGESTTDLAWDGQTMIWENRVYLVQSERSTQG